MKKEFLPYEQALALKELGFDEECLAAYLDNKLHYNLIGHPYTSHAERLAAPLCQQAFRFFREKHNLVHSVDIDDTDTYFVCVDTEIWGKYKTYPEAELACLKKLIEIVKD